MEFARPLGSEPVVSKTVNSAFIGTPLENLLRERGFQRLVIAGLTTDHCVSTTVRMASNLGFQTYVAAEATATHDRLGYDGSFFPAETVHQVALASLNGEFAEVATTEVLLKRLLSWDRQALAII
jgi:nicotinamidase-related amidase